MPRRKEATSWDKVNIPSDMARAIDKYLSSDLAKEKGFKSRSDVVIAGVRSILEKDGVYPKRPRFEHLNTYENHVKIIDNELSRIASVYFNAEKETYCDLCDASECIHTQFVWEIPQVAKILMDRGFKNPNDEILKK